MTESAIQFEEVLGSTTTDRRIEILRSIHLFGSISEAARANGVSYKAAWQAVETLGNLAGVPLTEKAVGGSGGGGTHLTRAGLQLMQAAEILNTARADALTRIRAAMNAEAVENIAVKDSGSRPELRNIVGIGLRTSMRNQLPCEVVEIQTRHADVQVTLALADGQHLVSRITRESLELLGLARGMSVLALCKATAVTVAPTIVGVGEVNILKGTISRRSRSSTDRQVSLALSPGLQIAGLTSPDSTSPLRLRQSAMAAVQASAVVIGLTG
ncbi:TOBE domain-containing protein [Orrella marina]|uniref:ModE family transcriptional regulator n=1 Tax=Orrella marina TaxID=2163011 RepID=A0A2R4XG52_9BURK|nr:TOBE domain-containing protein [Orrella marina]AWB32761.1 ModE family transcriptional regulator [Orrella marina]